MKKQTKKKNQKNSPGKKNLFTQFFNFIDEKIERTRGQNNKEKFKLFSQMKKQK